MLPAGVIIITTQNIQPTYPKISRNHAKLCSQGFIMCRIMLDAAPLYDIGSSLPRPSNASRV